MHRHTRRLRLHITKGVLHNQTENNAKTDYVKRIKEENLHIYKKNFLITRQNILSLSNLLKRALLTRTERELCSSEYGTICPEKLWNLGRTDNSMLFKRELLQDNSDFAVEVLIDASGSQQGRQSLVALQGFIISRALSLAQIPHRVTGFCTFGSYTILNEYRDYLDNSDADENIFEFYGSANNRDGLAIRAVADSLDKQPQENKILIVLSDGNPNDIIAANSRQKTEKQPYCLDFAVKDTATEIRRLRNRKISVLGVFAGEEEDLQAEKKIFGKDFAYIHDISNFANIVGQLSEKTNHRLDKKLPPHGYRTLSPVNVAVQVIISQKFLNQLYLLFPFQLFNLIFPAHSFRLGLKFFKINQLYRTSAFCIFCALPRIVTGNPFFQIVCPSGIKTAVAALYHIRIIHLLLP